MGGRGKQTPCTWHHSTPLALFAFLVYFGTPSVVDQNSKEFLKKFKYFLGSRSIFEKKCAKKGSKKGSKGFLAFGPILPYFHYFTLFRALFPMKRANAAARRPTYSDVKG